MITGHCECGSVSYQIDGRINDFSHCHCSQCRRLHGAAFATFGGVARNEFSYLSGLPDLSIYASSDTHNRVFCKHCGSNIMVELDSEPDTFYVAMGTINGDPELPPGYHIFAGSKPPWNAIHDALPQYETFPEDEPAR
jgi:hypothetical protein